MIPPLSTQGTLMDFEAALAPGVRGYAMQDTDGSIYIPDIRADKEGNGDVGRFLDSLDKGTRFKVPNVLSDRLAGMLTRRGYEKRTETDDVFGEAVEVYVKEPAK